MTSDTEQDLTNALIKAMSTMERKVYFLQGHGEKEPNKTERDGYSASAASLRRDNYMVERLVLAQMKDVPDDATVVLIAGPTTDILPTEAEALRRYLAKRGQADGDAGPPIGAKAAPLPNLEAHPQGVGHHARQQRRRRHQRRHQRPEHRRGGDLSAAPDHGDASRRSRSIRSRARRTGRGRHRTGASRSDRRNHAGQLGRVEPRVAHRRCRRVDGRGERRQTRAGRAGGRGVGACRGAAGAGHPATGEALKPETRVVVFGDSDFASNAYGGVRWAT